VWTAILSDAAAERGRAPLAISRIWLQASVLVFLVGFSVLGILAYRTYVAAPPIPGQVVASDGEVVFTGEEIQQGQHVFLANGLMEYGSVFGHGGYLGPDYTADYLHREALHLARSHGDADGIPSTYTIRELQENRFDRLTGTLRFTQGQVDAFEAAVVHYRDVLSGDGRETGLRPGAIAPEQIRPLTAFFAWSAWAASARRPGKDYSYTNNWPPEPLAGNHPTAATLLWSVLSLAALLGGIGLLLTVFGRYGILGWHAREQTSLRFRQPGEVALTAGQRATAAFFLVMAGLFLIQTLVGGASQHYRAEITNFFGLDLARFLPFNLARTWHVQLAIFWVSTSFLASGLFLAPMIAREEPRGQAGLAYVLLGALVVVVAGSMGGEFAGIHGWTASAWLGNQGLEYLDLGRLWQVLLTVGLGLWVAILYRTLRTRLRSEHLGNLPWVFFFSALALPAFYAVGLLARQESAFTVTDFWRFWVVHLWVEDFLELFTTTMVATIFVLLGVVSERVALRVVYLDILLYSVGGVIGTMHHLYFSGEPVEHMALGAFFSAAEVIPLTFLTVEAWTFLQLGEGQLAGSDAPFPHRWAVLFLVAVGFWNFVGAGIFGFLINLPIVSYFEIGTALTANHGHAAMMGVYGMLAAGLALFCLRYLVPSDRWSDAAAKLSFWSLNLGLAWMVFATMFPLGAVQLYVAVNDGYFAARELAFHARPLVLLLEWLRLPGDALFIVGGVLPLLWLSWLGVRHRAPTIAKSRPESALFTLPTPAADTSVVPREERP